MPHIRKSPPEDRVYNLSTFSLLQKTVATSLHKKLVLWSDALRYSGCHWDAAVAAGRGMLRKHLTTTDLVNMWVKCKRDAERTGNKKLKV